MEGFDFHVILWAFIGFVAVGVAAVGFLAPGGGIYFPGGKLPGNYALVLVVGEDGEVIYQGQEDLLNLAKNPLVWVTKDKTFLIDKAVVNFNDNLGEAVDLENSNLRVSFLKSGDNYYLIDCAEVNKKLYFYLEDISKPPLTGSFLGGDFSIKEYVNDYFTGEMFFSENKGEHTITDTAWEPLFDVNRPLPPNWMTEGGYQGILDPDDPIGSSRSETCLDIVSFDVGGGRTGALCLGFVSEVGSLGDERQAAFLQFRINF